MKKIKFLVAFFLLSAAGGAYAQICPSTTPACTTSSSTTLAALDGTYVCTEIATNSSSVSSNAVVVMTLNGAGAFSVVKQALNNNSGGASTYSDFAAGASGTYCINTAGNGYLIPTSPTGTCPLAMVADDSGKELRIIDTAENNAEAFLCQR
jgi:hypothetical protein